MLRAFVSNTLNSVFHILLRFFEESMLKRLSIFVVIVEILVSILFLLHFVHLFDDSKFTSLPLVFTLGLDFAFKLVLSVFHDLGPVVLLSLT